MSEQDTTTDQSSKSTRISTQKQIDPWEGRKIELLTVIKKINTEEGAAIDIIPSECITQKGRREQTIMLWLQICHHKKTIINVEMNPYTRNDGMPVIRGIPRISAFDLPLKNMKEFDSMGYIENPYTGGRMAKEMWYFCGFCFKNLKQEYLIRFSFDLDKYKSAHKLVADSKSKEPKPTPFESLHNVAQMLLLSPQPIQQSEDANTAAAPQGGAIPDPPPVMASVGPQPVEENEYTVLKRKIQSTIDSTIDISEQARLASAKRVCLVKLAECLKKREEAKLKLEKNKEEVEKMIGEVPDNYAARTALNLRYSIEQVVKDTQATHKEILDEKEKKQNLENLLHALQSNKTAKDKLEMERALNKALYDQIKELEDETDAPKQNT